MSKRPLRWAVVGTGVVSASFSRALAKAPGNLRQVIVSRDLGSAQRFGAQHGFTSALALDESVFQRDDIDVFYIATPTANHMDLCLRAIAAGKPVLCEKPMTASAEQLLAVQEAARTAKVFAMEGMWLRFNPIIAQLREKLNRIECGDVVAASMQVGYAQASESKTDINPSCDAFSVFGCYGFSLALHLFGRPLRVLASGRTRSNAAVEHAQVLLAYAGFTFTLETSIVADTRNALEVLGSSSRLAIPASVIDPYRLASTAWAGGSGRSKLWRRVQGLGHAFVDQLAPLHPLRGSGFHGEIAEVGRCLEEGRLDSEVNPFSATLACHEIEQAARTSLASGQWQSLPV